MLRSRAALVRRQKVLRPQFVAGGLRALERIFQPQRFAAQASCRRRKSCRAWRRSIRWDRCGGHGPPWPPRVRIRCESSVVPEVLAEVLLRAVAEHRHDQPGFPTLHHLTSQQSRRENVASRRKSPPAILPRGPGGEPWRRHPRFRSRDCRPPDSHHKTPAGSPWACASVLPAHESRSRVAPTSTCTPGKSRLRRRVTPVNVPLVPMAATK